MTKKICVKIMGILNVTPDSAYDGGEYQTLEAAVKRAIQIEQEGGSWIDIGGESTRPGAHPVDIQEELRRVIPVIKKILEVTKLPISIDTKKAEVARKAIEAGATMINDVSGLSDPKMIEIAKETKVPVCVMHMQGTPETMQKNPLYPRGCVVELIDWFKNKIDCLMDAGIAQEQLILDPGIGFGKTVAHNFEILENLHRFKGIGFPLLLGHSRKSFLMHHLKKPRTHLLPASLAVASYAILQGVEILRVHDVESHHDVLEVLAGIR